MTPLRFAIVGCGRISRRYVESLQRMGDATLVAAVEVDEGRARAFQEAHGIPVFPSIAALLGSTSTPFEVACVCTPSGLHAENAIELLKARKHVVVEKPMALCLADADRMIETARSMDCRLFVTKQNRFNPPVQAARQALEKGRFGKLTLGTVRVRWMRDQSYYDQAAWRGTWAMDGGVFANQASHHIDLLEWFFGEVETVYAKTSTQLVQIQCEDMGLALLRFKSGAMGVIEATTATRPMDLEGSLSIMGSAGAVEISGFAVNRLRHFEFEPRCNEDEDIKATYLDNPPSVYGFGHLAYLKNVLECLRGMAPAAVDGAEGRKSLELINALYVSAETAKEIRVSENRIQSRLGQNSR
jgi:predicted dehydrogenase